jgi:hypothetical protein
MLAHRLVLATLALVIPASATVALLPWAGQGEVSFPENFAAGVLYATIDRADTKQRLELFAPPEALAAARKGERLPDGTVLTMLRFNAELDAEGNPLRDADGRFVKAALAGYSVMEKQRGWGAEHPAPLRNGEWAFRRFTPSREVDNSLAEIACLQCHKIQHRQDFVFSRDRMRRLN